MTAIARVLPSQPTRASTALNAISDMILAQRQTVASVAKKYGQAADPDVASADRVRYSLRRRIVSGWSRRREVASVVVCPLSCYPETEPTISATELLDLNGARCIAGSECAMAEIMKRAPDQIESLRKAIQSQPSK